MIGLIGLNWFNQNNTVGRDLWAMSLAEGGGNPGMKHNPIYVKEEVREPAAKTVESVDADYLSPEEETETSIEAFGESNETDFIDMEDTDASPENDTEIIYE